MVLSFHEQNVSLSLSGSPSAVCARQSARDRSEASGAAFQTVVCLRYPQNNSLRSAFVNCQSGTKVNNLRRVSFSAMTALSPRESELAQLVAIGCTNAAITRKLRIAPQTVKNHVRAVCLKMEVRNRVLLSLKLADLRPTEPVNRREDSLPRREAFPSALV